MKWVTREYVHLDRVASPWLIKRFVDTQAEFVFVAWLHEDRRPHDAVPFALPGAELGPHDADGTTFEKIAAKYQLHEPAIARLGRVVRAGVEFVLHEKRPAADDVDGQTAVGLVTISEGLWLIHNDDSAILEAGFTVYDALYANYRAQHTIATRNLTVPGHADGRGPSAQVEFLRALTS
jgi:hypothetical protein